jgi:hypothetical protein
VAAAAFVLLQTLDVKKGQGLDWHLEKITVREVLMKAKAPLRSVTKYSLVTLRIPGDLVLLLFLFKSFL